MEKQQVTFRDLEKSDFTIIEKIIIDTWHYEEFCKPNTARHMAKFYLQSCLTEQTFSKVALMNQQVVGIIMAKSEESHKGSFTHFYKPFIACLPLLITKEGRKTLKMFHSFYKIDQELLAQSSKTFSGELSFFVLDEKARGLGIGKALFRQAKAYLQSEKVKDFYLYTDSTCNYSFYEHEGLHRIGEKTMHLPSQALDLHFFLYEYALTPQQH